MPEETKKMKLNHDLKNMEGKRRELNESSDPVWKVLLVGLKMRQCNDRQGMGEEKLAVKHGTGLEILK